MKVSEMLKDRAFTWLLLIIVLALGLRVARACIDTGIDKDSVIYLWMAKEAASGNIEGAVSLNQRMPPLYIGLMALGEYAGIGAFNTGIAVSIIAGTLLLIPVFWLGKKLISERIGLYAALLVAIHPYLLRLSAEIMRDSLFYLLLITAVAFAVKAAEKGVLWWIAPGIFTGLATMTRTEGIEIIFAAIIWFLVGVYFAFKERNVKFIIRRTFLSVSLLVCSFIVVTVPIQLLLGGSQSLWGPVDYRISSFFRGFMNLKAEEVLQKEKH